MVDPDAENSLLDAARDCILAVGWRRTTLTDVARRADVSRMTLYRRWPDMATLLSDLMVREWATVVEQTSLIGKNPSPDQLATSLANTVRELRANALFFKIVSVDPELLLPYLLDRRGRTQDSMLVLLRTAISSGQATGSIRSGDPGSMARSLLLAAHGFTISAHTMASGTRTPGLATASEAVATVPELDEQLREMVQKYLTP